MFSKRRNHTTPVYPNSLRRKYITYLGFYKSVDKSLNKRLFLKSLSGHRVETISRGWGVVYETDTPCTVQRGQVYTGHDA